MSLSALYYHLVIRTKNGKKTLPEQHKAGLYGYMAGIIVKRDCTAVKINGIENHIYLLIRVTPSMVFSDLVHDLKLGATHYIKMHRAEFPDFNGWGKEYAVFSCSASDCTRIIQYIVNQDTHHEKVSAEDEMKRFCEMAEIDYYEL